MKYKSMVIEFSYAETIAIYDKENECIRVKVGQMTFYKFSQDASDFTAAKIKEWLIPQLIRKLEIISSRIEQIQSLAYLEDV